MLHPSKPATVYLSFENRTTEPLHSLRLTTDCGCVRIVAIRSAEKLEPGSAGEVELRVDAVGRKSGAFSQRIRLQAAHEGGRVDSTLIVEGIVQSNFEILSPSVDFGRRVGGEVADGTILLRGRGKEWKVSGVEWRNALAGLPNPRLSCSLSPSTGITKLTVSFRAPRINGFHERDLVVTTSHPDLPRFMIASRLEVFGGVNVIPPRISLGRAVSGLIGPWFPILIQGVTDVGGINVVYGTKPSTTPWLEISSARVCDEGTELMCRFVGDGVPEGSHRAMIRFEAGRAKSIHKLPVRVVVGARAPSGEKGK